MSLSLRPPESAGIGDDIRRRMEGRVEVMEDALLLLDSVSRAVTRGVREADDAATVREAIAQLPRLDECAEKLATVPTADALVRRYTQLKKDLEKQLNAPSLRAGLTSLIEQRAVEVVPPTDNDTILLEAGTLPSWLRGAISVIVGGTVTFLTKEPLWLGAIPALWIAMNIFMPRDRWFAIQPHRLFVNRRFHRAPYEVKWPAKSSLENTPRFTTWVSLLTGPWLNALSPHKQKVVALKGRDDARDESGTVFLTSAGVLFIADDAQAFVPVALVDTKITATLPWRKLVEALQHATNWQTLGPHLAAKCDGAWLARGTFTVEEAGPVTLRLNGSTRRNEETTGNRGRWSLVQLTLDPWKRTAALELLEETKAQAT